MEVLEKTQEEEKDLVLLQEDPLEIEILEDLIEEKENLLNYIKLFVLNVGKKPKFHSSQQETSLYIAEIVLIKNQLQ
jgi:hypothetical protein